MLITINYHSHSFSRDVDASEVNGVIVGTVGTASVKWDKRYYPFPIVRFSGAYVSGKKAVLCKHLIRLFLNEYFFLLDGHSPLAFLPTKKTESSVSYEGITPSSSNHTSGVPLWMKEEHKVWTECFKKDGSSYFRRTRYKEDSRDVVDKYLPSCSSCQFRLTCERPCSSPELQSVNK